MIPRFRPAIGWRELAAAFGPGGSDDVTGFERAFAEEMGQRQAVAFPYGRTGLMLLLEALGLRDREVICPAYTCVVVPHAIVYSGNHPVFVDSRAGEYNMDLDLAERAITGRTGALVATSIFGYPVDLDRLDQIRQRHPQVAIIQDCAHSFAAEWRGRQVQREGVAAIFGLNISKLITSIFGGMVTTDRDEVAARLRALRAARLRPASLGKSLRRLAYLLAVYPAFSEPVYGLVNQVERRGWLDRFVRYYDEARIDMPADHLEAMTAVEARVGQVQVGRYRSIVAARRRLAAHYDRALSEVAGVTRPPLVDGATYSHYVPASPDPEAQVANALRRRIQLGRLIAYNIPDMPAYQGARSLPPGCPVARELARVALNLPTSRAVPAPEKLFMPALSGR